MQRDSMDERGELSEQESTMSVGSMLRVAVVVAAVIAGAAGTAFAQEAAGDKVEFKKRTVIDLSGATIEGELTKPEGSYIVNRKLSRFSNLITAREDFFNELVTSHNEL